jgi:ribosome biogenesis GTPase / thiamine phosphate phosphatase
MSEKQLKGRIVRAQSGFFTVETREGLITARLRGRHTQGRQESDAAALGDLVTLSVFPDGTAVVEEIEERTRALSRKAPGRESEQILVANPDQAVFVMSCADPDPNFRMLDRFLVVAERENIPAVVCANKLDLVVPSSAREEFGLYKTLGYPVVYTSAVTGKGIRQLRKILKNRLSVLAGPSGVGKSTLLNALEPGLGLRTHEVRDKTKKGHHTTVVPELFPLEIGGYVADTPGVKAFALWDIEPEELDAYFPEMRDLVSGCEFSDCTHIHEPGCAVLDALDKGRITPERYDSYCRIRFGDEE